MINLKLGENALVYGKVENVNKGEHFYNATIVLDNKSKVNLKIFDADIELVLGRVYQFEIVKTIKNEDLIFELENVVDIEDISSGESMLDILNDFYDYAPISLREIRDGIENYISKIESPVLRELTEAIYDDYRDEYYLHPAATKFHHAYVGGLGFHTLTMLKIADGMLDIYSYLNRDLVYSGIILHDIGKIEEITGVDGEYTPVGQMLGHIVIGTDLIERYSFDLGYNNLEEVMLLKHIVVAHHGILNYGSPKKPQIGEALLIWLIDTMDSKLAVLGDELIKVKPGEFTNSIGVLDKMRFYNAKFDKDNNKK